MAQIKIEDKLDEIINLLGNKDQINKGKQEVRKMLIARSREILGSQIESYRTTQNKAQIAIGVTSIFFTAVLAFIEKADLWIKIVTILPMILLIIGVIYAIIILSPRDLLRGYNEQQFNKLLNKSIKDVELYEIGANKKSILKNGKILVGVQKKYIKCMNLIAFSVIISILLLFVHFCNQ